MTEKTLVTQDDFMDMVCGLLNDYDYHSDDYDDAEALNEVSEELEKDYEVAKKVNRFTRAGKYGREVFCPKCGTSARVYHFSWVACQCDGCKKMIEKDDYFTK